MPKVNGKKFPYTAKGMKKAYEAAEKEFKRAKPTKKKG